MKCVAPHPPTKPTCRVFHAVALSGLLTLAFINPATAADFQGSLKGATITDAQTTNKPPVAAFTYAIDGDTVTLDASDSSDPDGSIAKYKWDFGDGTTSDGTTVTHVPTGTANLKVTLTVIDNNHGVTLNQQTIIPSSSGIRDDFSVDSSSNYTNITGSMTVSNGMAHGKQWTDSRVYHKTKLLSDDQFIEADVYYSGVSTGASLLVRVNPSALTGYLAYFELGKIQLASFTGSTKKWIASYNGSYGAGVYRLRIEAIGETIRVLVNDNQKIHITESSHTTGNHVGLRFNQEISSNDMYIDNMISGIL